MIAQQMAIDYPDVIEKLVLAVTAARPTRTMAGVLNNWIKMAETGKYKELVSDTMEKTYTPEKYSTYKLLLPIITRIGKPRDLSRFMIQARAILEHNLYEELEWIQCPALIIGGDDDKVTGPGASEEIAEKIKQSKLIIYKGLGHGAYEETKDFDLQVIKFLG